MAKRSDWHYALHIRGVSSNTLDMGRIGEYLTEFANLIGHEARPRFAGMVKGSVVLRSIEQSEHPALVRVRLRDAVSQDNSPAHRAFEKINSMMAKDGARGEVIDRQKAVVIQFPGTQTPSVSAEELTVTDKGELDGQLVSIVGADDTVHIRLQDVGGLTHKIVVTKLNLAQDLAKCFRTGWLRVQVHGTWKRTTVCEANGLRVMSLSKLPVPDAARQMSIEDQAAASAKSGAEANSVPTSAPSTSANTPSAQ